VGWPSVGCDTTRSTGGPNLVPGMGIRCVVSRCQRSPDQPTVGLGILVTASQSPAAFVAASPARPSVGGRPRGRSRPGRWGLPAPPARTCTPCAPPDGLGGQVRPRVEVTPNGRGHQCCVRGQDLPRCHALTRRPRKWQGSPGKQVMGAAVSGGLVVEGVGGRPAPPLSVSGAPLLTSASSGRIASGLPPTIPRRRCVGGRVIACIATRAINSTFPTISVVSHPGPPLPGREAPACPLSSPREIRGAKGAEHGLGRMGTGVGPGFTSTSPYVGNSKARHQDRFGGRLSIQGQPRGGPMS